MPSPSALPASIAWTRGLAAGSATALIALGLAWELWLAPTGHGTLAIKVLPLFIAVPGLLRMRLYTYRWTSLLVWLYVGEGLVRAASDRGTGTLLASLEVALGLLLFTACALHVRSRLRNGAALAP